MFSLSDYANSLIPATTKSIEPQMLRFSQGKSIRSYSACNEGSRGAKRNYPRNCHSGPSKTQIFNVLAHAWRYDTRTI